MVTSNPERDRYVIPVIDFEPLDELIGYAFLDWPVRYDLVIAHDDALIRTVSLTEPTIAFLKSIYVGDLNAFCLVIEDHKADLNFDNSND